MISAKEKALVSQKIAAQVALNRLSSWAADFKPTMGVIDERRVVTIMRAIVNGFEGFSDEEREVALEEALEDWGINYQLYMMQENNDDAE